MNIDLTNILGVSERSPMSTPDFFRSRLDSMIDLRHPLAVLATRMSWASIEATLAPIFERRSRDGRVSEAVDLFGVNSLELAGGVSAAGRPRLSTRLMVGLLYLKHAYNESDDSVTAVRSLTKDSAGRATAEKKPRRGCWMPLFYDLNRRGCWMPLFYDLKSVLVIRRPAIRATSSDDSVDGLLIFLIEVIMSDLPSSLMGVLNRVAEGHYAGAVKLAGVTVQLAMKGKTMKISIAVTVISVLPLLSCSQQLAASPQAEAQAAQGGHVRNSISSNAVTVKPTGTITQADIDQQIAADKQSIRAGLEPPDVIDYDLKIAAMMPEAHEILAHNDRARARAWLAKEQALMTARNKSIEDFLAPSTAMNNAIANVLESSRVSRGSGGGQQQHNPNETFVCGSGPGPGQRQVGEAAGGNGVAPTPICSWN